MVKYKWKVEPKPTGRYSSFDRRGWPSAETPSGEAIAILSCATEYIPSLVKSGKHEPITMRIRIRSQKNPTTWIWAKFTEQFATLPDAKNALQRYLQAHPEHDFLFSETTS
jgi:maltose-binding protein MalE